MGKEIDIIMGLDILSRFKVHLFPDGMGLRLSGQQVPIFQLQPDESIPREGKCTDSPAIVSLTAAGSASPGREGVAALSSMLAYPGGAL